MKLLSEENYELRERLLKKDVEIEKVKTDGTKAQENIVNKILRKENDELHHEKEQLKLERDRLRHVVNEKQDKTEKLVAGICSGEELNLNKYIYRRHLFCLTPWLTHQNTSFRFKRHGRPAGPSETRAGRSS